MATKVSTHVQGSWVSDKCPSPSVLSCLSGLRQALKERLTSNPFLDAQVQSRFSVPMSRSDQIR